MKIQMDQKMRVVALSNLEAMCKRVSGVCHNYSVVIETANRVQVEYSNPDEYGNPHPMRAVFPCWKPPQDCMFSSPEDRYVVLDILKVRFDNWDGEGWQAFQPLLDCPELYRSSPEGTDWKTKEEWEASKAVKS